MEEKTLYEERQYFRQWWIWLLLLIPMILLGFGIVKQVVFKEPFGDNPMTDSGLVISAGLLAVLAFLFIIFRLDTQIKQDGIYVRFYPVRLRFKYYSWDEISKCYLREYNPFVEFGGWGIRYSLSGRGRALNISGNQGLQIEFKNGKKLLIGTRRPEEMKMVIPERYDFDPLRETEKAFT